jgi:acetyl-CoA carboxylase carboxyl transferase subunit beta
MTKYVSVHITQKEPPAVEATLDGGSRCKGCQEALAPGELQANSSVCPHCGHHYAIGAPERLLQLADADTWEELGEDIQPGDPLEFFDVRPYIERLDEAQLDTGLSEAFLAGLCSLGGRSVALGLLDFRFMGGSMGSVVGERFARLIYRAIEERRPVVTVVASGGARMQEGILSLMQMPKTVVALDMLAEQGLPYISVLTHPTTGGVLASFATLADVIVAEPGALLCFTGPRVIEQTTREKLPEDFGLAEGSLLHGQIDMVVPRPELKDRLVHLLVLLEGGVRCDLRQPLRPDEKDLPWRGRSLAQAIARAKDLALSPRGWLRGRDPQDRGEA